MAVCPAHPCTKAFLLLLLVQFQCLLVFSFLPLLMVPFFVVFSQWRRPPLFVKFPDSYEDPVLSATTLDVWLSRSPVAPSGDGNSLLLRWSFLRYGGLLLRAPLTLNRLDGMMFLTDGC